MENIYKNFRLNHNQKKEAKEIIEELMLQDRTLTLESFKKFESDANKISDAFITYIRELRYPEYSRYKKKLSSLLKSIHNQNTYFRIIYNDNFESDAYTINYLCNSASEMAKAKNMLEEKSNYLEELSLLITGKVGL